MEITSLTESSIRIKGKQASFAVNPIQLKTKIAVQAALFFQKLDQTADMKYFEEEPLIIQGPGDYEVNSVKISVNKAGEGYIYQIVLDGVDLLIAKGSTLAKAKDIVTEYHMVLLDADVAIDQSLLTALNPNVLIFFGEKKEEVAKAFGQETPSVTKFVITKEKLPVDTQIVVLQ